MSSAFPMANSGIGAASSAEKAAAQTPADKALLQTRSRK